jgi:ParB family transcriptional regulator, chromosome partitioning protein
MHPADEFAAFKTLSDEGHGAETIAARFGTTSRLVEQRLKLAVVSPKLVAAYRKDEMTLEQLMAFTVSDSHKIQERTWRELPQWQKESGEPESIRDQLTEKHIDAAQDSLARFVTVAAYEAAGGGVVRDLFADESQPGYLTDAKLLTRLADEKLKAIAEPFKAEGWKWVDIKPDFDWTEQQKFGRVSPALTKEQKAEIVALERQQEQLYEEHGDENLPPKLEAKSIEIEQQLDAIKGEVAFTLAQKALAGVVITIGHNGHAEIKRGLVKPEDKRAAAKAEATGKPAKPKAKGEEAERAEPGMSAALVENLTAHRTAALQAKLATNPKVALVAVTHALALSVLERSGYSTVQITGREPNLTAAGEELAKTPAAKEFAAATREATKGMPRESGKLWTWLMQQDQRRMLSILAVAAAHSVDALQRKFNGADRAHADQLATALKLDMAAFWQATAEGFFSRVSKDQTLAAVAQAAGKATAEGMAGMKKSDLATAAEKATKGKGWLPAILQNG